MGNDEFGNEFEGLTYNNKRPEGAIWDENYGDSGGDGI